MDLGAVAVREATEPTGVQRPRAIPAAVSAECTEDQVGLVGLPEHAPWRVLESVDAPF